MANRSGGWSGPFMRGSVLVGLITAQVAVAPMRALAHPPPAPSAEDIIIADGAWHGTFYGIGDSNIGGQSAFSTWEGTMQFVSVAGLLDGDFTSTVDVTLTGPFGSGIGTGSGQGKVTGPANMPELAVSSTVMNITATSGGVSNTYTFDGPGGDMSIDLVGATCSMVLGDFGVSMEQEFADMGYPSDVVGDFLAVRDGDLLPEDVPNYQQELTDLVQQAVDFKTQVQTDHTVDGQKLGDLLKQAELLASAIKQNNDCGFTTQGQFITPITNSLIELIHFALDNPDYFSNADLALLASAGVQVGALGSGATNPQEASQLQATFVNVLAQRLDEAVSNGDCAGVEAVLVAATYLGDAPFKAQIETQLSATCP